MKIEQTTFDVQRSGSFQENVCLIENTPQMFEILSSKIYTNAPLAIVRELSTNASDSHTDAGCPEKPFDVHLPNMLEPWFSIRDYGTGISPDNMIAIYRMYGKSTRTGSNETTGCLGIGSKSPFAYTDQFTVTSIWNGYKYTYSIFKNEEGVSSTALLNSVETNEPNGVEVYVSIKPGDASSFVKAAQRVYTFFKVRPNIVGASLYFNELIPEISTPEFSLYNADRNILVGINVVMGQVCYTVAEDKIVNPFDYRATLTLNLPMGGVSFVAGREEVRYDEKTVTNINAALKAACEVAKAEFEGRVANEGPLMHKLRGLAKYRHFIHGLSIQGTQSIEPQETDKYSIKSCSLRRNDKLFVQSHFNSFYPGDYIENVVFIEDDADLTQNMKNRLRQYMLTVSKATFFLVTIKDQARFAELFGTVTTKLSLLPDVPRVKRDTSRTTARSKPIKLLNDHTNNSMLFEWNNIHAATDIDPVDACCVPRDGNWAIWKGQKVRPEVVRKIATALGFKRVYGIAEKRYEKSRVKHNIVELSAVAKERAEKLIANLDIHALSLLQYGNCINYRVDVNKLSGLSPECDDMIKTKNSKIDNVALYNELSVIFDIKIPTAPDYQAKFFEKYPILFAIDWYSGRMSMDTIVDYIKMVEASIVATQQTI